MCSESSEHCVFYLSVYFKGIQTEVTEKFCWTEFLRSSGTVTASVGCHSSYCLMWDLIIRRPRCGQFSGLFVCLFIYYYLLYYLPSVENISH